MKVTVVSHPPADRHAHDVILAVTVTTRRARRMPASTQTVTVAAWQGAAFVGGRIVSVSSLVGLRAWVDIEDVSLRRVVTRLVCDQLYWRDLADATIAEIPAFTTAQTRRFQAAFENTQAFKCAFAGTPLPRLPQEH